MILHIDWYIFIGELEETTLALKKAGKYTPDGKVRAELENCQQEMEKVEGRLEVK